MNFSLCEDTGFYLRLGLMGPSGSGKSYTALKLATEFGVDRVGIIDTESQSSRRYAKSFSKRFLSLDLNHFSPQDYIKAIEAAEKANLEFLVIDSLSHSWTGKGGVLEMADAAARRSKSGNSFNAWREVTPEHNKLVDALLRVPMHLIVTMRVKTEYTVVQDERGKSTPKRIGMAPIQREGLEYEFDIVGEMTQDNDLLITKSRCSEIAGKMYSRPGSELASILRSWVQPSPSPLTAWEQEIKEVNSQEDLDSIRERLNQERSKGAHFTPQQNESIRLALYEASQRLKQGAL